MFRDKNKNIPREIKLWVIQPILFICAIGLLLYNPTFIIQRTPDLFFGLWQNNKTVGEYLPQLPTEVSKLIRLGELLGHLSELKKHNLTNQTYLDEIFNLLLLNSKNDTRMTEIGNNLDLIRSQLLQGTQQGTVLSTILGFFSFVNLLWFGSICAIAVLFFPFLYAVLGEFMIIFGCKVLEFLTLISPMLEPLGYLMTYLLVVQGLRYLPDVGFFISLTGCFLFGSLMVYSDYKHWDENHESVDDRDWKFQLFHLLLFFAWAPVSLLYQSKLLGFFSVGVFFVYLGFTVAGNNLRWVIGYKNASLMERTATASLLLMSIFILVRLRVLVVNPYWFEPFTTGVLTFGMINYFLSMLIMSSKYYQPLRVHISDDVYIENQIKMIISLIFALFIGSIYQFSSLYNIGLTFTYIYLIEKSFEIELKNSMIIVLFLNAVVVYYVSLYLHTHPEFIINMFDASLTS